MSGPTSNARDALRRIATAEPARPGGIDAGANGRAADLSAEPAFDAAKRADIQGNIVPGFNKDFQHFLFFAIRDRARARRWVADIADEITTMDEALDFVVEYRARRLAEGVREVPDLTATWVNIAFSHSAIGTLAGARAGVFGEESFRQGLAVRSTYLGDPTSPEHPGHRDRWLVGGPHNEADVLVVVAADRPDHLEEKVAAILTRSGDLELLFEQRAATLPEPLGGHEHFGFKDGISQPGVRGRLPDKGDAPITRRHLETSGADPGDIRPDLFGLPGQVLVWPGQFLLGEPRQQPDDLLAAASPAEGTFPEWAALGSYLVCRRLRQDVDAFWDFAAEAAARAGIDPVHLASLLVGRWPSGAPLMRAATADDRDLAADRYANNHFLFEDPTRPVTLRPIKGYAGDHHPQAAGDVLGTVCPHFAHIRKTNPRDAATEMGKPQDSLARMILRRGIPFGPAIVPDPDESPCRTGEDRGLMFLCYGATIEDQFEFLTRRWANSPLQPNPGGHDPVIGQRDTRGERERYIEVPTADPPVRIAVERDFVIPTGGGYFFAPPISALTTVLGGD
ncbi:MAG: Dyp-type peroxidase [Pseudonocardia sp.]